MATIAVAHSGTSYAHGYRNATPYPHVVLRNFFDLDKLRAIAAEVRQFDFYDGEKDFHGARKKRHCGRYVKFPSQVKAFIDSCNSPMFLAFLEEMTGERGLVADPHFEGGGIHSLRTGGFLKIHADFNWHSKLHLYRRLNLLVYLNEGWQESWGGHLELWRQDMSSCAARIAPILGNAVIFTTDDQSFHGHPEAITCPEDVTRDSIALYYYSAKRPQDAARRLRDNTDYRARGMMDAKTIVARSREKLREMLRR